MPKETEIRPILIRKWKTGIAESPYEGYAEMRNVDATIHPGALLVTSKTSNTVSSSAAMSGAFTVNTGTDVITGPTMSYDIYGSGNTGIRAVTVSSTGTLPAPLAASTIYYIVSSGGATTYKIATNLTNANASTFIDITTAGTGTHTITSIDPTYFKHFAYDNGTSTLYGVDSNCRVWQQNGSLWYLIAGNTLTSGSGNGLAVYKGYLLAFRNALIDIIAISGIGTPGNWTNSWAALKGGTGTHRSLVGQDDILYWGDDDGANYNPYIGSLQQTSGSVFDPATASTYTFNNGALTLPKYKLVASLAELGVNLMIGSNSKEIYPWDRTSATFNLPIICAEKNITAMANVNNQLYMAAGNKANLYYFNGYLALPWKIFPKHLLALDGNSATVGAMTSQGRKILYTVQTVGNSGIYSVDYVNEERTLVMENTISNGAVGTNNPLTLPAIFSDGNSYYVSWNDPDDSAAGVDTSTDSGVFRYPTSTSAYVVTPNLDIGYFNVPKTLQYIEVYFDRPLITSCSVVVKYRMNLAASFTTLATINGDSTNQVFQINAGSISGTDVQFKFEINTSGSVTPYLQEVRLI